MTDASYNRSHGRMPSDEQMDGLLRDFFRLETPTELNQPFRTVRAESSTRIATTIAPKAGTVRVAPQRRRIFAVSALTVLALSLVVFLQTQKLGDAENSPVAEKSGERRRPIHALLDGTAPPTGEDDGAPPQFVFPSDKADFAIENGENIGQLAYSAYTESYTLFTFGLGVEINLPIKEVDLRIPFTVRGAYNPGVSDQRSERATHGPADQVIAEESFSTAFKYMVGGQLGLAVHF